MSTRNRQSASLLRAVDQTLRTLLGDTVDSGKPGSICGVTSGGKPPTWAGKVWYGIAAKGISGKSSEPQYSERTYGFSVTITCRVDAKPQDRLGNALLMAIDTGLLDQVDDVAEWLHGNYALLALANTLMASAQTLGVDTDQGFHEPAYFRGANDPMEQGAMWFGADPEKQSAAGVSCTLTFDGMNYIKGPRTS